MIKRYITRAGIVFYLLCAVTGVHAVQQPVTTITSGTGTTGLNLKQYNDTYINPRLTNIAANDTDLYTNKADKSSFSSSSAFEAAFGWDPGEGAGIQDAASDNKAYGRYNGSWAEVLRSIDLVNFSVSAPLVYTNGVLSISSEAYQPIDADLTVASGAAVAGNSKYFGTDSNGSVGFFNLPSSGVGFTPTKVTTDPTGSSNNGLYQNTVSGHWWNVDDQGISDISAGTYTAWDTTPESFGFGSITDAVAGQKYCYGTPITVSGIDRTTTVLPTSEATTYQIGGIDSTVQQAALGETITPCIYASETPGATVSGNLSIGGVIGSPAFTCTTALSGVTCSGNYGLSSTSGSSNTTMVDYEIILTKISVLCNGSNPVLNFLSKNDSSASNDYKLLVYTSVGGEPGNLLFTSNSQTIPVSASTVTLSATTSASITPGEYWIGVIANSSTGFMRRYSFSSATYESRKVVNGSFTPPNTWDTASDTELLSQAVAYLTF